jgi:hypothetical protein
LEQGGLCRNPCFECAPVNVNFTPATLAFFQGFEPEGLQLEPAVEAVSHYGPPTTPADFETWPVTARSTMVSRDVSWTVSQDEPGTPLIEVVVGSAGGTLPAGGEENLELAPTADAVSSPGLHVATSSFYDWTYGTRAPVAHEIHVGVDGFQLTPAAPLAGEGPGAPHGTMDEQSALNRWIVGQSTTVSTDQPWIELDDTPGPTSLSAWLPGKYMALPQPLVGVELDGSGMTPGVYVGEVTWESNDSGIPFSLSREVRMDLCRQIFPLSGLPVPFTVSPGQPFTATIQIPVPPSSPPDPHVTDVDVALEITGGQQQGPGHGGTLHASLVKVLGPTVLLSDKPTNLDVIYDDDTFPPLGSLSDFFGTYPWGTWKLRIEFEEGASGTFNGTLHRFEVRLHVDPSLACV